MGNLSAKTGFTPVQTRITLANNGNTTVQNFSAYDAQELTGFVFIDATTDYRASVKLQVVKNGAGTYEVAAADIAGDDNGGNPIVSFSMSGADLVATLVSYAGYSTAYIQFNLNAPALGGQFPLQVDGANVSVATGSLPGVVSTGTQTFAGDKTFNGSITPSGGIIGKTDGVAVAAGKVGQEISSVLSRGSASTLTSGNHFQVGSVQVTLTPGLWMLTGVLGYVGTTTALTHWRCGYNTTNTALTQVEYDAGFATVGAGSNNCNNQDLLLPLPTRIINIASNTTYYLMGFSTFSGGTLSAYGQIRAVRMPA